MPDPNLCEGNLARFEGLSLTLRHPELFDVKALHISPSWTDKAALRNRSCLPTSFATKIAKRLHKVTEPKHRPHNYYARFKMNLHFPGSTTGSYSRNLNRAARCPRLHAIAATSNQRLFSRRPLVDRCGRADLEARRRGALLPGTGARRSA